MQTAVEAAQTSEHPDSKVGSCIVGDGWQFSSPNFWPQPIQDKIGAGIRVGNSSGTIHAETACLLLTPNATYGASMFSTDPSCPNCAKNMAEAGIKHLYIDHKGFEKYFHQKRMADFETLTLEICTAAGIGVTRVFRKEGRLEEIIAPGNPDHVEDFSPHFASCVANGKELKVYGGASTGLIAPDPYEDSKYNLLMQPLNRLLMILAKDGLKPAPVSFISSRVPTSRELVNFIGAGYDTMQILDKTEGRDPESLVAFNTLQEKNILNVK